VAGFYVFAAHTVLSPRPFIHRAVFTDRNFLAGQVLMLLLGIQWLAVLVLLPPYVQDLAGYPVDMAGMIMAPTGIGNMISALAAGRMVGRMDTRLPLTLGAALMATAVWRMSLLTPDVEPFDVAALAALHGLGLGLYFVPLTVVTFSTLAPEHRDVGTSLYALVRNFGSSIGASLIIAHIVRHSQANHALLAQHVSPFAESMRHLPLPEVWSVGEAAGLAAINLEVSRQAAALAYASGFQFLSATMLIFVPMLLLIRLPKAAAPAMEAA
jgi:DHA2 family multidrug resistance protein